jgi:hypothetical protein
MAAVPESPTVQVTVDDVLAPMTYDDPGPAGTVWSLLEGAAEPTEADRELLRLWVMARTIAGYRASIAELPAVIAVADPDAIEGGPTHLILWVGGHEVPLETGFVPLTEIGLANPLSIDAWTAQMGANAITLLKAKTLVVQGAVQLETIRELLDLCEKDYGNGIVAQINDADRQTDAIESAASMLLLEAAADLGAIVPDLKATRTAAIAAGARAVRVSSAVEDFQNRKMDVWGSSLDEFWRRADDVPIIGTVFSFASAGDSRYRAQHLQMIHDGLISYNQFDAEMNGWKEYLSAGINVAMNVFAAKMAQASGPIFSINATWSPALSSATRNVFASFSTNIVKDAGLAVYLAAGDRSPDERRFLEGQIAGPGEALMGAGMGFGIDLAVNSMAAPGPVRVATPRVPASKFGSTTLAKLLMALHLGTKEATGELSSGEASGARPVPALTIPSGEPVGTGLEATGSILEGDAQGTAAAGESVPTLRVSFPRVYLVRGPFAEPEAGLMRVGGSRIGVAGEEPVVTPPPVDPGLLPPPTTLRTSLVERERRRGGGGRPRPLVPVSTGGAMDFQTAIPPPAPARIGGALVISRFDDVLVGAKKSHFREDVALIINQDPYHHPLRALLDERTLGTNDPQFRRPPYGRGGSRDVDWREHPYDWQAGHVRTGSARVVGTDGQVRVFDADVLVLQTRYQNQLQSNLHEAGGMGDITVDEVVVIGNIAVDVESAWDLWRRNYVDLTYEQMLNLPRLRL